MIHILFALVLLLGVQTAHAFSTTTCLDGETGTCRLASCGSDVQAAINASSSGGAGYISPTEFDGDGVYIQNCSSTSTSMSWTDKNINLRGQNACTLDSDGLPTSCPTNLNGSFSINITDAGGRKAAFAISNLQISVPGVFINYSNSNPHSEETLAGYFRVHHVKVDRDGTAANGLQHYGVVFGLYDHLNVTMASNASPWIEQSEYLNSEYGAQPDAFMGEFSARMFTPRGTVNNVYFEDSKITITGASGICPLSDSESGGGHLVFRYNTVTSAGCYYYFYAHWTRSIEINGVWREFYKNKMTCSGGCGDGWPFRLEAGSGVIYDNQFSGWGTNVIIINERRASFDGSETSSPAGVCDGSKAWDGNGGDTSAPGWPCAGQIGVGCLTPGGCTRSTMDSVPLIVWNNGTQTTCTTGGTCTGGPTIQVNDGGGTYIKSTAHTASVSRWNGAIDYCISSSKPSTCGTYTNNYSALTYPHPLQGGGSSPSAPANFRTAYLLEGTWLPF